MEAAREVAREGLALELPVEAWLVWLTAQTINRHDPLSARQNGSGNFKCCAKAIDAFMDDASIELTGPFALLHSRLSVADATEALSRHTQKKCKYAAAMHHRFPRDPPEAQPVAVVPEDGEGRHWVYFRDDPSECPRMVAELTANLPHRRGRCLHATLAGALYHRCSKPTRNVFESQWRKIVRDHSLGCPAPWEDYDGATVRSRVAEPWHGLGMVVPLRGSVGYRPIPMSKDRLLSLLEREASAREETNATLSLPSSASSSSRSTDSSLREVMTWAHIANDEGDYGMALELGINMWMLGVPLQKESLELLLVSYRLLQREAFRSIARTHAHVRRLDSRPGSAFDVLAWSGSAVGAASTSGGTASQERRASKRTATPLEEQSTPPRAKRRRTSASRNP